MIVRYSGKRSGDDPILDLVSEAAMDGAVAADKVLVVTNDRPLRDRASEGGAEHAAPVADRPAGRPAPGAVGPGAARHDRRGPAAGEPGQAPGGPAGGSGDDDDTKRGWKPGRGATAKTGPRRRSRATSGTRGSISP